MYFSGVRTLLRVPSTPTIGASSAAATYTGAASALAGSIVLAGAAALAAVVW